MLALIIGWTLRAVLDDFKVERWVIAQLRKLDTSSQPDSEKGK